MIALYSWLSAIYWTPGPLNSNLIKTEKAVPNNPENKAKIRYSVPISLAFEDKNHLSVQSEIFALKTERLESTAGLFDLVSSFRLIFILFKTKERWGWLSSKLSSDSLCLEKSLFRLFILAIG